MASTSAAEIMALAEIAKARRTNLVRMFSGTKLTFGLKAQAEAGKDLVSGGKSVYALARRSSSRASSASPRARAMSPSRAWHFARSPRRLR